jgi:hypothetical protein
MNSDEPGALTIDQLLDELDLLATVEHAMIIDYLVSACVLGHGLEQVGATAMSSQAQQAASAYQNLAQSEMFHLKGTSAGLVAAGRDLTMGRASSITSSMGDETPLSRPDAESPAAMLRRHQLAAEALDSRYDALRGALGALEASPEVARLQSSLPDLGTHRVALSNAGLPEPPPDDLMPVTWRTDPDEVEQRLLTASNTLYGVVVRSLIGQLTSSDFIAVPAFRQIAQDSMEVLDSMNTGLVQRGLLPPFGL